MTLTAADIHPDLLARAREVCDLSGLRANHGDNHPCATCERIARLAQEWAEKQAALRNLDRDKTIRASMLAQIARLVSPVTRTIAEERLVDAFPELSQGKPRAAAAL